MSSSKSLLDLLPKPKSEQNIFKSKTPVSTTTATTTTTTTTTKATIKQVKPTSTSLSNTNQPRSVASNATLTNKFSPTAVISSKPVPATSAATAAALRSSNKSSVTANYSKIKKTSENFFGIESYGNDTDEEDNVETGYNEYNNDYYNEAANVNNNVQTDPAIADVLKYESKKRRHDCSDINIVDVNLSEVIQKNKEDMLKNLTTEPIRPARQFVGTGRKHHQITYLAMLAKERDQELKSQWAENKFNRKQSKMKYGF